MTPLELHASIELAAAGDKPAKLRISAYGGDVMRVAGWGLVIIDLAGLKLDATIPILADHDNRLDSIIASGAPKSDGRSISVVAPLADTPKAAQVKMLISSGVKLKASVGVDPFSTRELRAGEEIDVNGRKIKITGFVTLVATGKLREVSVLPVGADESTEVTLAARGAIPMSDRPTPSPIEESVQAQREAMVADARRASAIKIICAGEHNEIEIQAITEGWSIDKTKAVVLEAAYQALGNGRDGRPPNALIQSSPLDLARASGTSSAQLLTAGVLLRAGFPKIAEKHLGERVTQAAEDLRCSSLVELCKAALHLEHRQIPSQRNEMIRATFSTTSLPEALANALGKIALDAYREQPATWRSFCRVGNARDFKPSKMIRLVVGGNFEKVGGGGELAHGTLKDSAFTIQIDTRGKMFGLTRTEIINDDLQMVSDLSIVLGKMGIRHVSDVVYEALLNNLEPDGATQFFTAPRANYITGADKILSMGGLSAGREAMRKMRDAEGNNIDVAPRTLVVSPENETTALQILGSESVSRAAATDQAPTGNPFAGAGKLGLEVEPRLSNPNFAGYSATAWYLFSSPSDGAVAVNFLDGKDSPTVEQADAPFETLGIQFRGYIDAGVSLADFRAALKSKGAA